MLLAPLAALTLATIFDFRKRQIPDSIPIALIVWAIGTTAIGVSSAGWTGRSGSIVGRWLSVETKWLYTMSTRSYVPAR